MNSRIRFASDRSNGSNIRKQLQREVTDSFDEMRSTRKLIGHASCVNALAWSNGSAEWLASGGDDNTVLLWNVYGDLEKPAASYLGSNGNIFALAFNSDNTFLYSAGTSGAIFQHDVSRLSDIPPAETGSGSSRRIPPFSKLPKHEDSVRDLSAHPTNSSILMSTSEDGIIAMHDVRTQGYRSRPVATISLRREAASGRFHPRTEHIFAGADAYGHVWLSDTRMAFNGFDSSVERGVVHEYVTYISRSPQKRLCHPEASSLVWDSEGSKLAVTFLRHRPTLYSLNDPYPLATFSGQRRPDGSRIPMGDRTYSNECTLKNGSFFGSSHYIAGSDDFYAYVWKLPSNEELVEQRKVISLQEWSEDDSSDTIGYASNSSQPRHVPLDLGTPTARLAGHQSICNTTLAHPHLPLLATCGIESYIRLHRSVGAPRSLEDPVEPSDDANDWVAGYPPTREFPVSISERERSRLMLAILGERRDSDGRLTYQNEDRSTIYLFDEILRQEGGVDIFRTRLVAEATEAGSDYEEEDDDALFRPDMETDSSEESSDDSDAIDMDWLN